MGSERDVQPSSETRRYRRVCELARGGMAILELARTEGAHGFEKYVAVKRISPKWADDPEFIDMFLAEARLAATLDHPNVVRVHDLGQDADGLFFVMDYIHGHNLAALMRALKGPVLLPHVLTVGTAVAAGLHHAHTRRDFEGRPLGLIHRDVSHTNILVTDEGGVKVVDFGIAKATTAPGGTRPSIRKGKIGYMSPEQCRGARMDARSDVFALGVVLFELLAGRRLFRGENEFAVMNQIVNVDAPPLGSEVPLCVAAVVERALARDPDQRFSDARMLERALRQAASEASVAISAASLGDFVIETFGVQPYPWESSVDPAGLSQDQAQDQAQAQPEEATAATRVEAVAPIAAEASPSKRRGGAVWLAGAVAATLGGGLWWMQAAPREPAEVADGPRAADVAEPMQPQTEPGPSDAEAAPNPAAALSPERSAAPPPDPVHKPESESAPTTAAEDEPRQEEAPPKRKSRRRPSAKRSTRAKKNATPSTPTPTDGAAEPAAPAKPAFDPDGLGPVREVLR